MSRASGKLSAQSLDLPEGEVGDLFCLGWIHVGILDGPVKINHAVVAYHRDDVGSEIFRLSIGIAADTVDLLDEVHVLSLCMWAFTLECCLPVIIESGSQPECPGSRFSFMLRNEVEVRIRVEDGRALPVVFGHEGEESRIPERSWMYRSFTRIVVAGVAFDTSLTVGGCSSSSGSSSLSVSRS